MNSSAHWAGLLACVVCLSACGDDVANGEPAGAGGGGGAGGSSTSTGDAATTGAGQTSTAETTSGAGQTSSGTTGTSSSTASSSSTSSGSSSSNSSSDTSTSSTSTMESSSTGGRDCEDVFDFLRPCETCLEGACCTELANCAADGDCSSCVNDANPNPEVCSTNRNLSALADCVASSCQEECFPPAQAECNPVTGGGCDVASGASCDTSAEGGFTCYASGNTHVLCEPCGDAGDGNFCEAGLSCVGGVCAKYCCDDGDCGTGFCDKSSFHVDEAPVGLCLAINTLEPNCDPPAVSPSNGACVMLP